MDTADWRQYHPFLRQAWQKHITAYVPSHVPDTVKVNDRINETKTRNMQIVTANEHQIQPTPVVVQQLYQTRPTQ